MAGSAWTVCERSSLLPDPSASCSSTIAPGAQPGDATGDDPVDTRSGGVPDAGRPADDAVPQPARHRNQERASEPVRRTEQGRRPAAGGVHHRLVQRTQLAGDLGRALEREQRVIVAVAGELVALGHDPARDLGVGAHVATEHEEGRSHAGRGQGVEHGRRELGAGAVIERDSRPRRRRPCRLPITRPNSRVLGVKRHHAT